MKQKKDVGDLMGNIFSRSLFYTKMYLVGAGKCVVIFLRVFILFIVGTFPSEAVPFFITILQNRPRADFPDVFITLH